MKFETIANCTYVKVGTIVEEATKISKRSAKSIEEERREAEEKVTSSTLDLDLLNSEKRFYNISSGGEARRVCEGKPGHLVQ